MLGQEDLKQHEGYEDKGAQAPELDYKEMEQQNMRMDENANEYQDELSGHQDGSSWMFS